MITFDRKELARELSLLQSVSEVKGTMPMLAYVKIEAAGGKAVLIASSLDVTLVAEMPCEGEFQGCIPLRPLTSLVKLFQDNVFIKGVENRVQVNSGRSRHVLPLVETVHFPQIEYPKGESLSVSGDLLRRMIEATSFWTIANPEGLKPSEIKFTGLSIRGDGEVLEVMATRKFTTAVAYAEHAGKFSAIVLPRALTAIASLEGEVKIASDERLAMFCCGARTVITRQMEGKFPEWRKFIPEMKYQMAIPAELPRSIKRANVTAEGSGLRVLFSREAIEIQTHGQSTETIPAQSNMNGEVVTVGLLGNQILDALRGSENVNCELRSADDPILFKVSREGFEAAYIIMPVRLQW